MPRASPAPGARLRCRRACDSCKRRKQKCNGEQPCTICVQRHKETECHFSDRPARLLKPGPPSSVLLSERVQPSSPQQETAMEHLLSSLEDRPMNVEQEVREGKDGAAPVPKVARLSGTAKGNISSLSFLQSVRRVVSSSIGKCDFTEDNSRHSMLEAFQSNPGSQAGPLVPPPSNDDAQKLARQYVLATKPLLDLFDLEEFHPRLANWVDNPTGDEDTVSSIFYLVLAIGAQVSDTNQTAAEQFFGSGRQLAFSAFQETPSIHTIQSYVLVSMYMLGACRRNGAFMNLGIALRAAYAVGIHRKDANALFIGRERRARERVWKSLRMMDLFLSASLGRPPATSDFDYDIRDDVTISKSQHEPEAMGTEKQLSVAVIALCRIFERILTDVYMKQAQTEKLTDTNMEESLAAGHVFGAYYWSIILLTRPFFVYRVAQYVKCKIDPSRPLEAPNGSSRISLFADACVYSALRGLDVMDGLTRFPSLPRRLPFSINTVFNSAVVLGAAFFADYDNLLPLEEGLNKAERFLELFVPNDPHACRFSQIIKYLRASVTEYVQRRNRQWMERRSKQVDQLFGQVGGTETPAFAHPSGLEPFTPTRPGGTQRPSAVASPISLDKFASETPAFVNPQSQIPAGGSQQLGCDVWDTLYNLPDAAANFPYDPSLPALTTSGIPVSYSPGSTIPTRQPPAANGPSPLSDMIFPENGLLYMAEDLPMFGIWDES
ncbi:hypothetical protein N7470_001330 [Penicillium chermesinum]|nr:hypothetical protein N7470_001330 [Penicillium chermesinum]